MFIYGSAAEHIRAGADPLLIENNDLDIMLRHSEIQTLCAALDQQRPLVMDNRGYKVMRLREPPRRWIDLLPIDDEVVAAFEQLPDNAYCQLGGLTVPVASPLTVAIVKRVFRGQPYALQPDKNNADIEELKARNYGGFEFTSAHRALFPIYRAALNRVLPQAGGLEI